jgi:aldehyde oxidoreductase
LKFRINGQVRDIECEGNEMLSAVLRRNGLIGTKVGCGAGQCGACSVILDGQLVLSCIKKMSLIPENAEITTIEGIGTPEQLHPLQQAWITYGGVQCGFCSPGFIVSAYQLLKENTSPTREEVRAWFMKHRNACRCTGYKPLVDAVMKAAAVMRGELTMDEISYHAPADGNYYGTSIPRPAAIGKVTGTCEFGDDYTLKEMPDDTLHLAVVLPDEAYAKILSIDTSEAEAMPGVFKVVTWEDIQGDNSIFMPVMHSRSTCVGFEHQVLNSEMVYHRGDVLALVCADTRDQARAAAKMVKVELEPLAPFENILESLAPDAEQIHPDHPNMYIEQPLFKGEDTRRVLEESAYVVEGSFYSQRQPHLVIEPDVVQAYMEDASLCVRCKSQMISTTAGLIGTGVGFDAVDMRFILNPTGASFGYSISPKTPALAAAACLVTERPVAMTLSYEEHQRITGKRAPSFTNARLGCDKDGKLTGIEFEIAYDKGAYSEVAYILIPKGVRFMGTPYTIPNAMGLSKGVMSNNAYSTAYKGFGAPQTCTASEQLMDMLAEKAGIDRFEFRYMNVFRPGDLNLNGEPYDVYPMEAILDKLRPYYYEAVARAKKEDTPTMRRGVGITCCHYNVCSDATDHAEVALELNPDGTITSFNTWQEMGQGAETGTLLNTYEALRPLGIRMDQIKLVMNDTALCPDTGPAAGSRSHYMAGNAYIDAANQLISAMTKPDGSFRTYDEMVEEGIETKYIGEHDTSDSTSELDPNDGHGRPSPEYTYGAMLTEVEVDTATGKTKVLSMRCVADVGVVAHPINVLGQAYGAMEHGIGMALSEDYDDWKKHRNLAGAGFPYIDAVPDDMNVEFIETPRPTGPHGSSGCAEMFQTTPHVCIINAIYDACGVRIHELPARPEKVLAGLKAIERGEKYEPERYYLGDDFYEYMDEIKANPVSTEFE